jgi:hypothetical protein
MELKQNVGTTVPVRLRAIVDGSALTGVTYDQVTCYIQKQGGASAAKAVTVGNWVEVDATHMPGEYDLTLLAGDLDTLGWFKYYVSYPGVSMHYAGLLEIVANLEYDTFTRLGAPVYGSTAGDIANVKSDVGAAVVSIKGASNKDLTQVDTDVGALASGISTISANVIKALGLLYDNSVLDNQSYDGSGNLTGARLRTYDTNAHAIAAGGTGLLMTYTVTATYDGGGNQTLFRIVEV